MFREGSQRNGTFGDWGGLPGFGSAVGATRRRVDARGRLAVSFLRQPPICAIQIVAVFSLLRAERRRAPLVSFDLSSSEVAVPGAGQ